MRVAYKVSYGQAMPSRLNNLLLLPEDRDVELSASFVAACPPACHHALTMMIMN